MTSPTASIYHDTRIEKRNEKYPVKIRIAYKSGYRLYHSGIDLSVNEFGNLSSLALTDLPKSSSDTLSKAELKDALKVITRVEAKAIAIIRKLEADFTHRQFKEELLSKHSEYRCIYIDYEDHIANLYESGSIETAVRYTCSMNSFKLFCENLRYKDVTANFLSKYEQWVCENDGGSNTIVMHVSAMRVILNMAISKGIISKQAYPFGNEEDGKFSIPGDRNTKKSISPSEINRIALYPTVEFSFKDRARDMWMFIYYCKGMNMEDLVKLKYKNINGNEIKYIRGGNYKNRKGEAKPIRIAISEEVKLIIDKWGNKNRSRESYIFPILEQKESPVRSSKLVQQVIHNTNRHMKHVGSEVGIETKLTTNVARRTCTGPAHHADVVEHTSNF